jgi:alpha,alpha-trehalase
VTPEGADPRLNHMKPLIAQGAYLASVFLKDSTWLKPYWSDLKKVVMYRPKNLWNKKYDLGVWYDSMESGADNNVAALDFPNTTVIATDVNTFLYREFKAMSLLAKQLGKQKDHEFFSERASTLKKNINKYLWGEEDGIYYNLDARTGEFIKRISYSCFLPLWGKLASQKQADLVVKNYMLSKKHMMSDYGMRTLSKQDPQYNNVNMIKPHSNWQGPVWPIANYIYMHGLLNYGYQKEALQLAETISNLVIKDIEKTGGMHEDYDAETGEPLAAPNFISWNVLVNNMIDESLSLSNPFAI